jgi:hypothetical protein
MSPLCPKAFCEPALARAYKSRGLGWPSRRGDGRRRKALKAKAEKLRPCARVASTVSAQFESRKSHSWVALQTCQAKRREGFMIGLRRGVYVMAGLACASFPGGSRDSGVARLAFAECDSHAVHPLALALSDHLQLNLPLFLSSTRGWTSTIKFRFPSGYTVTFFCLARVPACPRLCSLPAALLLLYPNGPTPAVYCLLTVLPDSVAPPTGSLTVCGLFLGSLGLPTCGPTTPGLFIAHY